MIKCENIYCKYHDRNNKCELRKAVIGSDSKCRNFEKGFLYYFYYFVNSNCSNFITMMELNDYMRYSIYYMMKCMPIEFSVDNVHGIVVLRDSETHDLLDRKGTLSMIDDKLDRDKFIACVNEFITEGLPKSSDDNKENSNGSDVATVFKEAKEFGWVTPTGEFIESPWGSHEESANKIVNDKGFKDEYNEWLTEQPNNTLGINYRDFLIHEKGYVLIHSPSYLGYQVVNIKPLTKKQRDFLYGYFLDMGMKLRAEEYVDE